MSKNEGDHITDLKKTFTNLREAGLKLNLEKCPFRNLSGTYILSNKEASGRIGKWATELS